MIQNKKIKRYRFAIAWLCSVLACGFMLYVSHNENTISTQDLTTKHSTVTLKDAYFKNDSPVGLFKNDLLVGLSKNREQKSYKKLNDFKIPDSGKIEVVIITTNTTDGTAKYAVPASKLPSIIKQNKKTDKQLHPALVASFVLFIPIILLIIQSIIVKLRNMGIANNAE